MDSGTLQGVGTIFAMAAFAAICVWAWSAKNKKRFDDASRLPFMDDPVNEELVSEELKEQPVGKEKSQDPEVQAGTDKDTDSYTASGKQHHE
jgi:cytochrome c oxidase cbb3-type subunit 4